MHVANDLQNPGCVAGQRMVHPDGRGTDRRQIHDVTAAGANVDKGNAQRKNVIHLAGMHHANEGFAHNHSVEIGRRQGGGKTVDGLVGQLPDVGELILCSEISHLPKLTTAPHKQENDRRVIAQGKCRAEQRIERMARAVVPGVHHDKLIR